MTKVNNFAYHVANIYFRVFTVPVPIIDHPHSHTWNVVLILVKIKACFYSFTLTDHRLTLKILNC